MKSIFLNLPLIVLIYLTAVEFTGIETEHIYERLSTVLVCMQIDDELKKSRKS